MDTKIVKKDPDLLDKGMIATVVLFIAVLMIRAGFAYFAGV